MLTSVQDAARRAIEEHQQLELPVRDSDAFVDYWQVNRAFDTYCYASDQAASSGMDGEINRFFIAIWAASTNRNRSFL